MSCKDCPLGKDDFERRMARYAKTIEEEGIPNEIYVYETYDEAAEDAEQFLWCDKVGGKVYCFGYCEDAYYEKIPKKDITTRKPTNKHDRILKQKNYFKRLSKKSFGYPASVTHTDTMSKNSKSYYQRLYRTHKSRYLKKQANRAVRRNKKGLSNGRNFCKIFDFQWKYC